MRNNIILVTLISLFILFNDFLCDKCLVLSYQSHALNHSSFCLDFNHFHNRHYPTELPEPHIPWIWDAIHDPVQNIVELTTMGRAPCKFDRDLWKRLVRFQPSKANQLGYGLDSNILVPTGNFTKSSWDDIELEGYLVGLTVICEYFHGTRLVSSLESLLIRGRKRYAAIGTLQIRCPTPSSKGLKWDRIRLQLNPDRTVYTSNIFTNYSATVPVCQIPVYKPLNKQYKISICSATGRADREQLVEWIEYYLVMGVEHFFIYDTSLESSFSNINSVLDDYIAEGRVTIVRWPFLNCVRHMANGRWATWYENDVKFDFKSPRAIAQSAALASCYSRFKYTSKYMIHVDDDEFMVFSPSKVKEYMKKPVDVKTLYDFAEVFFAENEIAAAIRFEPIFYHPCNNTKGVEHMVNSSIDYSHLKLPNHLQVYRKTPLPRIGVWSFSEPYDNYECKLLMRTDAVGMFFVHYVSLYEYGPWRTGHPFNDLTLPITATVLFHFKYPYQLSNTATENLQPINVDLYYFNCKRLVEYLSPGGYLENFTHAKIPVDIGEKLKVNYIKRINYH